MNNKCFAQKVAVITGAGSGIGLAIAKGLIHQGASVVINDISLEKAEQATTSLQQSGGDCTAFPGDAGKLEVIQGMVDCAVQMYGRIDFCIANAGLTCFGDFFSYSPEQFKAVMDLNLQGTFFLCQAAAQRMKDLGIKGKLLLMSSNIGTQTYPQLTAYSMSKAALQMMSKSLVLELSPYEITINALAPGATITPRTLENDPKYEQHWQDLIPLRKVATPEKIAEVALFLLSSAADHITGQTLVIDGGWSQKGQYPPSNNSTNSLLNI